MGVIVPNNIIKNNNLKDIVMDQICEYDENLEVDEYDEECTCKSYKAMKIVKELEDGMSY